MLGKLSEIGSSVLRGLGLQSKERVVSERAAVTQEVERVLSRPEELGKNEVEEKSAAMKLLRENASNVLEVGERNIVATYTTIVGNKRASYRLSFSPYFIRDGSASVGHVGVWFEKDGDPQALDTVVEGAPLMLLSNMGNQRATNLVKYFGKDRRIEA